MTKAYIGIGSNQGDKKNNIAKALDLLNGNKTRYLSPCPKLNGGKTGYLSPCPKLNGGKTGYLSPCPMFAVKPPFVIASEAKQSRRSEVSGLLRRYAPRNDGGVNARQGDRYLVSFRIVRRKTGGQVHCPRLLKKSRKFVGANCVRPHGSAERRGEHSSPLRVGGELATFSTSDTGPPVLLLRVAPLYRSAPIGYTRQDWFLNTVAELETDLPPLALLELLLAIETEMGRERRERWGPRLIDLDLLLYGAVVMDAPNLTLPHPRMHERAFVMAPLADLSPRLDLPGYGRAEELAGRLKQEQAIERYCPPENDRGPGQ